MTTTNVCTQEYLVYLRVQGHWNFENNPINNLGKCVAEESFAGIRDAWAARVRIYWRNHLYIMLFATIPNSRRTAATSGRSRSRSSTMQSMYTRTYK